MATINARMQQRKDTAALWSSHNPILRSGELGLETDTGELKVGDGVTRWNDLDYALGGLTEAVTAAQTAQGLAEDAQAAVEAVVATTDGLMAAVDADDASDFRVQEENRWKGPYTTLAQRLRGLDKSGGLSPAAFSAPTDGSDSHAQMQDWISFCKSDGVTAKLDPNTTYTMTDTLLYDDGMEFCGAGRTSIIKQTTPGKPAMASRNWLVGAGGSFTQRTLLHDFTIDAEPTHALSHGLVFRGYSSTIRDIEIKNAGGDGLHLTHKLSDGSSIAWNMVDGRIKGIDVHNQNGYGLFLGAQSNNRLTDWFLDDVFINCRTGAAGGVYLGSAAGWKMGRAHIYGYPNGHGMHILNATHTDLDDVYVEHFEGAAVYLAQLQHFINIGRISARGGTNPSKVLHVAGISGAVPSTRVNVDTIAVTQDNDVDVTTVQNDLSTAIVNVGKMTGGGVFKDRIIKTAGYGAPQIRYQELPAETLIEDMLTTSSVGRPLRQGVIGDSITVGTTGVANQVKYQSLAPILAGGRVTHWATSALAGERSDHALLRVPGLLALNPDVVVTMTGMNDAIQNVPLATYAANIAAIAYKVRAAKAMPVFLNVTPRLASTANIEKYNAWLAQWGRENDVYVIDVHSLLVDPATGALKADYDGGGSYTPDGYHVNGAGRNRIAQALADFYVATLPPVAPALVTNNASTLNMIVNGCMMTDVDAGGLADSWAAGVYSGTRPTWSLVDRPGFLGKAQKFEFPNIVSTQAFEQTPTGTVAPGDRLYFGFRIDVENASTDDNSGGTGVAFWIDWVGGAAQTPMLSYIRDPIEGGLFEAVVTVPPSATRANPTFYMVGKASQDMTIYLGQVTMLNLTSLGL